jgi:uncharacterized protein (TIGR01319 family)
VGVLALADFGSTYTKVRLVERDGGRLLAAAQAPTTVGTDLMEGYAAALSAAQRELGRPVELEEEIAASSAGGGLRVAAVGLVADLTAAAAHQAALNAGARVETVLSGNLGEPELERLASARPEIVLFAGGTDGGQGELVLENARRLAAHGLDAHVVVACNAEVAEAVGETLAGAGIETELAANVMPALGRLEIDSAREAISRVFLEHVIGGKGLSAGPEFTRMVRMPTPEAVLRGVRLLARGVPGQEGIGDAIVLDVGGATTDVHSDRAEDPATPGIEEPLLPAPLTLRTVEGDLGLRAGAAGVLAADGRWLAEQRGGEDGALERAVTERAQHPAWLPENAEEANLDRLLAVGCATHALARHCGTMLLSPGGGRGEPPTLARSGPDLREVRRVIGTGGAFAHGGAGEEILTAALDRRGPRSLAPKDAQVAVDRRYILATAGLVETIDPEAAFLLLKDELVGDGDG